MKNDNDKSTLEHYTFMESYHDAMRTLVTKNLNYESYGVLMYYINEYALYGNEPDTSDNGDFNDTELMVWKLVKPILERTRTKALAGKSGGHQSKAIGNRNAVKPSKNQAKTKQKPTDMDKEKDREIKKDSLSLSVSVPADTPYSKYVEWRMEKCPHLSKMQEMSEKEFTFVFSHYDRQAVFDTLLAMENYKDTAKKNRTIYRTLRNWLNRHNDSEREKGGDR